MSDPTSRRPDIDALRVACILLLHLYHSARMFNVNDPWHVKAPVLLPALNGPMDVLHLVRMPLLMLIAGMATAFALRRRSLGAFAWDRVKRLLLPLVFGMLVIVPPQIWVERVWTGQYGGSYWAFWPSVFQGVPYPKGSLSWHHLWFVAYLFVFCLAALPLLHWFRSAGGSRFLSRAEAFLARGANLWWLALPIMGGRFLLRNHPETHDLVRDPKNLVFYGGLFLAGHLMGRLPRLDERLVALRHWHLGLAALLLAALLPDGEFPFPFEHLAIYAFAWASMCAALGYGRAHLTRSTPLLHHAQSLAYPFYIFHQSVIVVMGWWMLRFQLPPWTFFGLLTAGSFLVTWGLCEGVAQVRWLRPCLGMGPRTPARPHPREARLGAILSDEAR
ncbi:membrane protein [Geothrix limicola]|uniref:Membrane protein n=1 Tax=Geothrix limicola TaxID=2927978 RepID=A0ABQ5QJ25_9BACT|nr:acyltransferase [Geothrix limicola]GLH74682.1 membrane protein [Geothrix limicola]